MFKIISSSATDFVIVRPLRGDEPLNLLDRRSRRYSSPRPNLLPFPESSFSSPIKCTNTLDTHPPSTYRAKRSRSSTFESREHSPYPVAPGAYVGCVGSSQNYDALKLGDITTVVRISSSDLDAANMTRFDEVVYITAIFKDKADTFILDQISTVYSKLFPTLMSGKAWLSHCQMGQSRSVAMTMGMMLHLFFSGKMAEISQLNELHTTLSASTTPVLDLYRSMLQTRSTSPTPLFPDMMAPNISFMAQLEFIPLMYKPDLPPDFNAKDFFKCHFKNWGDVYRRSDSGFSESQVDDLDIRIHEYALGLLSDPHTPELQQFSATPPPERFPLEFENQLISFLLAKPLP